MRHETAIAPAAVETPHDSASKHVTGRADYTDDLVEPAGTLHACLGLGKIAHGRITALDLAAVRAAPPRRAMAGPPAGGRASGATST